MPLVVKFAVYGALPGGHGDDAKAADVTAKLQEIINANQGVATCDNASFGVDPAPNSVKHFGALVTRDGTDFVFACQEGQKIDFFLGGAQSGPASDLIVKFAVYGALPNGDPFQAQAVDVKKHLQDILDIGINPVKCNNDTFGEPALGTRKHFAAVVARDGVDLRFACEEGQSINFRSGGT